MGKEAGIEIIKIISYLIIIISCVGLFCSAIIYWDWQSTGFSLIRGSNIKDGKFYQESSNPIDDFKLYITRGAYNDIMDYNGSGSV